MHIPSIKKEIDFFTRVNALVKDGYDYIEAITAYCEENDLDVESVTPLIKANSKFKAQLQEEAERLNLITKSAKLPLE
jgi:hypothetical protein